MKPAILIASALALCLGVEATAAAQTPAPSAVSFEMEYEASILNIVTLGRSSINAALTPGAYRVTASLQTSGFASMFDDTRIAVSAGGARHAARLISTAYSLSHHYARKSRRVAMQRANGALTARVTPAYRDLGSPPASAAQINASQDPLTALAAMSAHMASARVCAGRYLVYDGKQHYALMLSPSARGTYRGGGYDGAAIICRMRYEPIAGFKPMTVAERAQIPTAEVWFAGEVEADFAPILRIAAPTRVGEARLDLKKLKRPG
jgi:hypothetical protein